MTKPIAGGRPLNVVAAPGRRVRDPVMLAIGITTLVGLLLRAYQLARPGFLLGVIEYDDGADFGSAIRLVHGALPYRDFIMVQPPGITLLMAPIAFAAKALGTAGALAIGRVVTVLASAAGVVLAGLLVRHRGVLAVVVTCGTLAVFPDSIAAAKTVLLEPWLVLFCLLGALAVFERDRLAGSGRRLALGGLAFGFAGAVKVWAILPVAIVLVLAARQPRRAARFAAGVAVGFLGAVLPFAALAPRTFYESVVVAQLVRVDAVRVPLGQRLADMSGLSHLPNPVLVAIVTVLIVLFTAGSCVVATRLTGHGPAPLEWFALGTFALIVAAFLWPSDFYYHYSAFLAPFLGLAIGLPTARVLAAIHSAAIPRAAEGDGFGPAADARALSAQETARQRDASAPVRSAPEQVSPPGPAAPAGRSAAAGPAGDARAAAAGHGSLLARVAGDRRVLSRLTTGAALWTAAVLLGLFAIVQAATESSLAAAVPATAIAGARHLIKPGACVLADQVSYAMAADRFVSSDPRCSLMVDGVGTDYALSAGRNGVTGAASSPQVRATWMSAFRAAQYVWLTGASDRRIPWTPQLHSYFTSHFAPVTKGADRIFVRTASPPGR